MNKLIMDLASVLTSTTGYSTNYLVDIYGTSTNESHAISRKYEREIDDVSKRIVLGFNDKSTIEKKQIIDAWNKPDNLKNSIKKKYHFLYVDFSIVLYSDNKSDYFTTIEVVRADNTK